jgi:hypothetical protein
MRCRLVATVTKGVEARRDTSKADDEKKEGGQCIQPEMSPEPGSPSGKVRNAAAVGSLKSRYTAMVVVNSDTIRVAP